MAATTPTRAPKRTVSKSRAAGVQPKEKSAEPKDRGDEAIAKAQADAKAKTTTTTQGVGGRKGGDGEEPKQPKGRQAKQAKVKASVDLTELTAISKRTAELEAELRTCKDRRLALIKQASEQGAKPEALAEAIGLSKPRLIQLRAK